MNCSQIQDLILTDYLDNQLDEKKGKIIEKHLKDCTRCREFVEIARKGVVEPFSQVERIDPPGFLWERIKESISAEQQLGKRCSLPWVEKIRELIVMPKPAVVFLVVLVLVALIGIMTPSKVRRQQAANMKEQEQVAYLAFLTEESSAGVVNEGNGFGTLIEEYFL